MATIKIQRTNEYKNRFRAVKILIDGKQIDTIANGETKEFTTAEGQHKIQAKIDWCSSPDILVILNDNEVKNLQIGSSTKNDWVTTLPFVLLIIVLHFILSKFFNFHYTGLLLIPTFLIMIYQLSIGRNNYLTLILVKYVIL